jgi:hypothetical protein
MNSLSPGNTPIGYNTINAVYCIPNQKIKKQAYTSK